MADLIAPPGLETLDLITGTPSDELLTGSDTADLILAGGGDDTVMGLGGDDSLAGQSGDDLLNGGSGDDTLLGAAGADTMVGGSGDDLIYAGDSDKDVIDGGSGHDILSFAMASQAAYIVTGGGSHIQGVEVIVGSAFADQITGVAGVTAIDGGAGDDGLSSFYGARLTGGDGDDALTVANGRAAGGDGDDLLFGEGGATLLGGAGDDTLRGDSAGADTMIGGAGDDFIFAINGSNLMEGGIGKDTLAGASGVDTFRFDETARHGVDLIQNLAASDIIDLAAIDADTTTAGDQAFTRVGAFDGHAGELVLSGTKHFTLAQMDTDGDGHADITIRLDGAHTDFNHFVL